jgi:DNA segregation ATPase FtsK/SpoIIIE, S-DNA-T family
MAIRHLPGRRRRLAAPVLHLESSSIFGRIHLGIDEDATRVLLTLIYRNLLLAGEPGSGKSGGINLVTAHAALSPDCDLWLMDGKRVELGLWRACAARFVGASITDATDALTELQAEMDDRYDGLDADNRRMILAGDSVRPIVLVIDELAYYSATTGDKRQRETFSILLRDLVARGRAAGIIVVAATQRPSHDIIPTSLRDLFGYRLAFRCTSDTSSDIVLGHGWATRGYSAAEIDPDDRGVGWLLAEGGIPRRIRCAYLTDDDIRDIASRAAAIRAEDRR